MSVFVPCGLRVCEGRGDKESCHGLGVSPSSALKCQGYRCLWKVDDRGECECVFCCLKVREGE